MQKDSDIKFPKRFLWGAATSAHQVEGNSSNQWTVWEKENAAIKAAQATYQYQDLAIWPTIASRATAAENFTSGAAGDHYNRYEEDFTILKRLGLMPIVSVSNGHGSSRPKVRGMSKRSSTTESTLQHLKR